MILSMLEDGLVVKKNCEIPMFDYSCNVLCVGAGSAGCYAADSAAREGAKVFLLELGENIGGMHVCGNVTKYYYGARGGNHEEDDQKSKDDTVFLTNGRHWEQRQLHITERLLKSGVTLLCRHSVIGLYFDGNRVVGILAFDGTREISIRADITIDATSDGHLIRMTDVKKRYGRPSDGSFVPFGVFLCYTKNGALYSQNNDSGIMNHYSEKDFSRNTILAHANAYRMIENEELVSCALYTGVREGLTYEGEDSVLYENVLFHKLPQRILFWAYSDLDRHGSLRATEENLFQNWWVISNLSTVTMSIPVSMGSVVPKGVKGLVTAGRCFSCDTYIQSAVRMNRDMFRMGECIGTAAAMAALSDMDFSDVDYESYLKRVKERGCFGKYSDIEFSFDNSYKMYLDKMASMGRIPDPQYEGLPLDASIYEPIEFDVNKKFQLLKTDAPGVAIWSCYVNPNKEIIKRRLYREMRNTEEPLYRYNCAITLGLLEDKRALPILRDIVRSRDCFFFTDNRRSNQFRSAVAVCLLGRIGSAEDLPILFELLSDQEINRQMYHTLKPNYLYHKVADRNFVYFAMLTHACMAIYKIYRRQGLCMEELHRRFEDLFRDDRLLRLVTDATSGEAAYEELDGFFKYVLKITGSQLCPSSE
ncbi:MAG: FAD-dependent oxidoreductase [Ruminococcaceae bacterium]|nr:FAD-dependent oxidoreductase [Oscillospiraceae bacterium]